MCTVVRFAAFLIFASLVRSQETETTDLLTGTGCGRTSQVAGGIVVSHQPLDTLPPISNDFVCFFQMRSMRFNQLVRFMFTHFNLTPNDCSRSNLTFFDGTMDTDPEIALICPDTADVLTREFVSTGNWLTIKLQVSSDSADVRSANFSGFYVSYTENRDPCVDPDQELLCDNGRCIFQVLECDGIDSCGDGTDEQSAAPTFCGATTGAETTAASTSSITTSTTPPGLFSDLTPLYIILTIAFAMLAAYVVYILLSFQWFKTFMLGCLHRCFLFAIRKRRKWRETDEEGKGNLTPKVTPQEFGMGNSLNENTISPTNDPVSIPPAFMASSSPVANGIL